MGALHEKCAVVGVSLRSAKSEAAHMTYQALFALQHRGVEGSGIVTTDKTGTLRSVRRPGMVRDVYSSEDIAALVGGTAIGHNRYSTNGGRYAHLQPALSEDIGFALAHNGNLPDITNLEAYLNKRNYITKSLNDSEMLAKAIASKLHGGRSIEQAVREVEALVQGAYSCVGMHAGYLFAFRDSHGIRPLEMGKVKSGIVFGSETCALETVGATWLRSVTPGELIIAKDGRIVSTIQLHPPSPHFDMFELVYFARHDSHMAGRRVNEIRRRFGYALAALHPPHHSDTSRAVVVAVPDTSVPAAEGYAEKTGLPNETLIIKNRYVGRTFMQPSQASRKSDLSRKHTMIAERIKDRDVYLIDDSIVRGNTIPRLIALAREQGARSVSVLIASPPVRYPDFYGIDTPSQDELIAANMTVEQMRDVFGADYLGFLTVDAMVAATGRPASEFNLAAFTGEYPVSIGSRAKDIRAPISTEFDQG